ncbi:hypothetical protein JAAARDRAFT_206414 [Jaapia argillacea MUCL 33604]|uniref:Uncharacterized protein n=1 Tax=Jaapia argillacea MUCL 33604 TaxID=933084 RepID=A0A067PXA5_9AGAM|nr:hypothetical protein JAAARDRAFT_206414 [Jaapia argillacea MUCL 33604]
MAQQALTFVSTLVDVDNIARISCTGTTCVRCYGTFQQSQAGHELVLSDQASAASSVFAALTQLVSDIIMIYRSYQLWEKNIWIIALPVLSLIGTTIVGLWYSEVILEIAASASGPVSRSIALNILAQKLLALVNILSAVTTVLTTVLIVSRIWWITRGIQDTLGSRATRRYHRIIRMILESGLVFSVTLIVSAVFLFSPSTWDLSAPVADIAASLAVIAPTLIVIRVGLGGDKDQTTLDHSRVLRRIPPVSPAPAGNLYDALPELEVGTGFQDGAEAAIQERLMETPSA